MKARRIVEEMDSYVPGRSQDEIAADFNLKKEDIIKLGSNENPWGPSPKAMEAIRDEISSINRYPESQLHELVSEIADYAGVRDSQVIIGGDGADEIIDVLAKTFIDDGDEFIVPLPSYMYYEYLLKQYGAKPVYAKWDLDANELDVESIFDKRGFKLMYVGGSVISSVEFHGNMSLVLFMSKCPLACRYCHNVELLEDNTEKSFEEITQEIDSSADFLDAIVISGG